VIRDDEGGEGMQSRTRALLLVLGLLVAVCVFELMRFNSPVANVSAVEVSGNIGVYWDAGCSNRTYSIDWGVLSVGKSKNVVVYVRNEGNETVFLTMTTSNFVPANASAYLTPAFDCRGHKIKVDNVVEVTVSLFVSWRAKGNSTFSFNMVFEGNKYVLGDLNGDGVVNFSDAVIFSSAFGRTPSEKSWNPDADLNEDGKVDLFDALLFSTLFGAE
jgi:hypothetical protein